MGQFDSLIGAARQAIKKANSLLESDSTPFNVMYKQYKILQSFWFRVIEDACDSNSRRLEELSVDLEDTVQRCEQWIKDNSPNKTKPVQQEGDEEGAK